ncbi:MAG TPA: sulfurtransferase [Actinobacteria bacterium]|nr:sulfurtransferase [Actinomycetota bacterium]
MSGWLSRLFPARPKVGPEQARELLDQGAILLDVREDAEWRAGHAPKARHIPLSRPPARLRDVPPNRTVVTVCRSGARSARAARAAWATPGAGRPAGSERPRRPAAAGCPRRRWPASG